MRTKSFLCIALSTVLAAAFSSCSKDEKPGDNNGGSTGGNGEVVALTLSTSSVEVLAGESADVTIVSGNGGYTAVSASETVATASVSGNTITVSGFQAGSTIITVKDAQKKAAALQVKVTKGGTNVINTSVTYLYEKQSGERGYKYKQTWIDWEPAGPNRVTGVPICSKRDINNTTENSVRYKAESDIKNFLASNPELDDDAIFLPGYIGEGTTAKDFDTGYSVVVVVPTTIDDTAHPGCKVMTVVTCAVNGETTPGGTAWYDPSDGSINLKDCAGSLEWDNGASKWIFNMCRKFTPEN